ncbi:hypothetical protein S245_026408, partial [Arachis hypogaea]
MLVQACSNSPNLILEGKVSAADDGSVAGGDRWGAFSFQSATNKAQSRDERTYVPGLKRWVNRDIDSIHGLGSMGFFIRPRFLVFSHYHLSVINFYVIEEDALNEEYCVQVLRILITKADTEIKVLEKDLSSLQNELACAEHEKWPEICCSALTERINWLDVAISALKKDLADEIETGLLLHSKPAETLNEIVKALQRDHCQDENSQVGDLGYASEVGNYADYLGAPNEVLFVIDVNIIIPSRS